MYAVFQINGKQYKASNGQVIRLEKLNEKIGKLVDLNKILMIVKDKEVKIGSPFIKESTIKAEIITHGRERKIKIIKFRRRKQYRKHQGHRQWFTDLRIISITTQ